MSVAVVNADQKQPGWEEDLFGLYFRVTVYLSGKSRQERKQLAPSDQLSEQGEMDVICACSQPAFSALIQGQA